LNHQLKLDSRINITAALLALAACGLFFVSCLSPSQKAQGTKADWRAWVTTAAGDGSPGFGDVDASSARFSDPFGVVVATDGTVYVADAGEANRIRKLTPRGEVSTLAGGREGFADGAGEAASFNTPSALALDREGNLYVADTGNNRIRKITKEGNVTTVAGDGNTGFRDGPASQAQFNAPVGVALDKDGNVYVADTYNDRIRLITKEGEVRTFAGAGRPGQMDGASDAALFDTPCALVVTQAGDVYVADTGNNRLRKITKDGQVATLNLFAPPATAPNNVATQSAPQDVDAPADAQATTGGNSNTATSVDANTTTSINANTTASVNANITASSTSPFEMSKPVGLALTSDGFLYVTELDRGRVVQVAPGGAARIIAGLGSGFADGDGRTSARFNQPAGVALAPDGSLLVADGANYLLRRLSPIEQTGANRVAQSTTGNARSANDDNARSANDVDARSANHSTSDVSPSPAREAIPRINAASLGDTFPWPLDPQGRWHEVSATMGEVRGAYGTDDSRDHLHSGIDVFGVYGQTVRAVREEKVSSPLCNWGFGTLNEGLRAGLLTYVHLRVGRDERDETLDNTRFVAVRDEAGKVARVRVRRGTRLRVGDALGTINRMYHVHMNLGPPGAEMNPLALPLAGFADHSPPVIERDGVQLFDESGARLNERRAGRLILRGRVRIVVDGYDQVDGNQPRRRLGLYRLGFQLLLPDGSPAHGFDAPRIQIEFNRLPPGSDAPKIAYADASGITVYGSKQTRFLYEVTNTVRDGRAARGAWDTSELAPGDYTLRIIAADFNGNEATANRDLPITIERQR
jgi:sugar lactone lactonase YvrE